MREQTLVWMITAHIYQIHVGNACCNHPDTCQVIILQYTYIRICEDVKCLASDMKNMITRHLFRDI